jgi:hypothetical protein
MIVDTVDQRAIEVEEEGDLSHATPIVRARDGSEFLDRP